MNEPLGWPDERERQALGLELELVDDWVSRELQGAPVRGPEHWTALARAAGVSASPARHAQAETPSDHAGPVQP